MSTDYAKLLDRAYSNLPKSVGTGERFEIPRVVGIRMGRRTIIQNFGDISSKINRDPHHLLKFLSRELATAASLDGAEQSSRVDSTCKQSRGYSTYMQKGSSSAQFATGLTLRSRRRAVTCSFVARLAVLGLPYCPSRKCIL